MKTMTGNKGWGGPATLIVLALAMAVGGCAAGNILKWSDVNSAAFMASGPGKQAYETIRFETFGPRAEQIFGYFLYKEGIEVVTGGGVPVTKLGKKTLAEVMADYDSVRKARMYTSGSNLFLREIFRGGAVVGYTANDLNMDVQLWDITEGEGPVVLRLVYRDLRREGDRLDSPPFRRPY
jgi:hypothetical protein